MTALMKSVSGIRGIVGESLTVENALQFAKRFGVFCNEKKIIVGRDSRTTGVMLFNAISAGLMSVGVDLIDLGICPTPTILLAVENSDAEGGIAITASHNPPQWNALKLISKDGMFITQIQMQEFWNLPEDKITYKTWQNIGKIYTDNTAIDKHIKAILNNSLVDADAIRKQEYRVVIDSTNGAGGLISPRLLKELGCEVIELFSEPTGIFSRIAEPSAENLKDLEKLVVNKSADIGFATDPDVDRLSVVTEQGNALGTEYSLLLAEDYALSRKKGCIATNVSSSMASEDIAERYGVQILRTKVGEINVVEAIKAHNCIIGGEGNGGIILPEVHCTRDAPLGMALILSYMAKTGKPISELAANIPHYFMVKEKLPLHDETNFNFIISELKEKYSEKKFDFTDGIKVISNDWWIHIRKSGTEPVVRIIAESKSKEKSEKLIYEIKKLLK
ncbi:MAG: phosphoglucosamine mutase [Candidatus Cloacimonadia bacterium]